MSWQAAAARSLSASRMRASFCFFHDLSCSLAAQRPPITVVKTKPKASVTTLAKMLFAIWPPLPEPLDVRLTSRRPCGCGTRTPGQQIGAPLTGDTDFVDSVAFST